MSKRRDFELSEERICELLFGDDSDNEEDLHLDNEDVYKSKMFKIQK